ncbi:flavin reductase family protein [Arthrobacter crystallopoietes]|uniref:NADH-FMN oxidoreductase RutF, flavin reductase (DIM6/NTAB) family n=1 Tax=Crystallibacter crystallopoietes TaxID=37928 RepID=A0A1H1AJR2_9MICC|nr:flavin reductase family protein [Arthrobacter crystallopoietes]AUI51502.1 flavin oxidoreductase [Arthrobacter crystallopoietes]SDQ39884.1 NADH-FMN oxidoreductase RutF, flavin reductase (DIM6/NTAB) family [Arthrobacter crystallopoietes]
MSRGQAMQRVAEGAFEDMLSADRFKAAFRNHPAGVAVVTADPGDGPVGLTASSVISVSANPPLLVFSLSAYSSAAPALARAETVVVHLLGADHVHLAKTFATAGIDRFADNDSWSRLVTGEPVLAEAPTWLRGRIVQRMEAGDSTVVAVQVLQVQTPEPEETPDPLVYHNRAWHRLGEQSVLA